MKTKSKNSKKKAPKFAPRFKNRDDGEFSKNLRAPWPKGVSGNPKGRKPGTVNFKTLFREAVTVLATEKGVKPEAYERALVMSGLKRAVYDEKLWRDIHDRIHGKAQQPIDVTSNGQTLGEVIDEIKKRKTKESVK